MSAPTILLDRHLVDELHRVLARLRTARTVDPKHAEPIGKMKPHVNCGVCTAEGRLNYLIDQIPRKAHANGPLRPRSG
jgi:hypothetical protein